MLPSRFFSCPISSRGYSFDQSAHPGRRPAGCPNTEVPATNTRAPASYAAPIVSTSTPPSISISQAGLRSLNICCTCRILRSVWDEGLSAEAGIDGHHQDQIDLFDDLIQNACRCRRIERYAGLLAQLLDVLQRPIKVHGSFLVHDDQIGARLREAFHVALRLHDHQVRFHQQLRRAAQRRHHRQAKADVGHVHAIHHVDLKAIRAALLGGGT